MVSETKFEQQHSYRCRPVRPGEGDKYSPTKDVAAGSRGAETAKCWYRLIDSTSSLVQRTKGLMRNPEIPRLHFERTRLAPVEILVSLSRPLKRQP